MDDEEQYIEGQLLLILFLAEVNHLKLELCRAGLLIAEGEGRAKFVAGNHAQFAKIMSELELESISKKQGRLHILPRDQARLLVSLHGSLLPLKQIALRATVATGQDRIEKIKNAEMLIHGLVEAAEKAERICIEALQGMRD